MSISAPPGLADRYSHLISKHNAMEVLLKELLNGCMSASPPDFDKRYAWLLRSSLEAIGTDPPNGPDGGRDA